MSTKDQSQDTEQRLYGPTVRYADGKVTPGEALDVEGILARFEQLDADSLSAFLCIIAHDLTVAVRSIVFDPPVTEVGLDTVKWINESLHRLTSCVNPHKRWSARDEALLVRGIIENAFQHGFAWAVGHGLAAAAGNATRTANTVAAK